MAYRIEKFTFSTVVPDTKKIPFFKIPDISFADAEHETIYLEDDKNTFTSVLTQVKKTQKLLIDTEFGDTILDQGSTLTFAAGKLSAITHSQSGEYYYVFFPYTLDPKDDSLEIVGDMKTVLVAPVMETTARFDPDGSYDFQTLSNYIDIPMPNTDIPASYLKTSCFASGTMIETASGRRPVESLAVGDLVVTRDSGLRAICWIGHREVSAHHLDIAPNLRPIRIRAGALGVGLPAQELLVSPQHRVLIASNIARRITGKYEALVAARHLCGMPGIEIDNPAGGVVYHHLLFDRHELVRSNGCWSESMYTGPQALMSVGPAARREIRALFPQLVTSSSGTAQPARRFMSGGEARELRRRHLKNSKQLLDQE